MKFVELKKHLSMQKYLFCYNLVGDDSYLIDFAQNLFFGQVAGNNILNKTVLSADSLDKNSFENAIYATSFFATQKVVIIKDVIVQKNKTVINSIKEYIEKTPNDLTVLVVVSDEKIFDTAYIQKNADKVDVVDCNRLDVNTVETWIKSVLAKKQVEISKDAIAKLVDYTNGYLSKISVELNKLVAYKTDKLINVIDIETLVSKDLEYSVFELTENLGKGNTQKTFEILNHMMQDKKSAPTVFALIQSYFRRMFFSVITSGTDAQIASMLGVKEFAVKKAKSTAVLFTKQVLKSIVDLCTELDLKIKSSVVLYEDAIDFLVMFALTNNKKYV